MGFFIYQCDAEINIHSFGAIASSTRQSERNLSRGDGRDSDIYPASHILTGNTLTDKNVNFSCGRTGGRPTGPRRQENRFVHASGTQSRAKLSSSLSSGPHKKSHLQFSSMFRVRDLLQNLFQWTDGCRSHLPRSRNSPHSQATASANL